MPASILRVIRPVSPAAGAFALGRALRGRARLGVLLLGLLGAVLFVRGGPAPPATSPSHALAAYLADRGLVAEPAAVAWLAPAEGPLALRPVVFLAHRPDELRDVYYADVRATADGRVLGVWFLTNITRTSSADEALLAQLPGAVAYAARVGEQFDAIVRLELSGEAANVTAGWSARARLQNGLSNLQESGRSAGFGRVRYQFVRGIDTLELGTEAGQLVARIDGAELRLDAHAQQPLEGSELVQVSPQVKGRPGTITWLVDTIRNISWVGSEPIEWLEHKVFSLTDRANRAYHDLVGTDVEAEVQLALPVAATASALPEERRALLTVTDPELGWPPAPLRPELEPVVRGEGQWLPLVDDPFVNANPNAPPAFFQTFLRVDPVRDFTRVYITLWDPRQVQLHIVSGTREPESATGETGTGMIPREPELLEKLVAGFNGGFQALHGEFGMMSEGRVYLPPKPWAATVAVYDDGRVGMGSWPGPDRRREWDEESATQQIPRDMVALRQNLTSVVEDGEYNPWQRWWWGAAPGWVEEQTYIPRSGLCLTAEGFMAYLWGESMGPEELGKAMLALRCVRGMHLDMNSKHTGFEFYKPHAPGQPMPALSRPLTQAEFEGTAPGMQGFRFRARKAVTTMAPLRFPRYLERDPRDFFFLSLKNVLPGPDLQLSEGRVQFSSAGLPHAGWPHAFARAEVADDAAGDDSRAWLVRIDPARVRLVVLGGEAGEGHAEVGEGGARAPAADAGPSLLASLGPRAPAAGRDEGQGAGTGQAALYAVARRLRPGLAVGVPPPRAQVWLRGELLTGATQARAALGVDRHGFLLYAEAPAGAGGELGSRMRQAGAQQALALPAGWRLGFGVGENEVAVDGVTKLAALPKGAGLGFAPSSQAAAQVIHPDNVPMPYRRWGGLQDQRVRYFPKGEPRFKAPTDAL